MVPFHSGGPAPTHGGQAGRTAVQSPDAVAGVAAALVAAAAVTWLAMATLVTRPPVPPPGRALLALTAIALALVLLKLLLQVDDLDNGAWLALVLAAGFVGCQLIPPARQAASK